MRAAVKALREMTEGHDTSGNLSARWELLYTTEKASRTGPCAMHDRDCVDAMIVDAA